MRVRRTSQVHLTMPIALAAALAALFALLGAVIALQGIRVSGESRAQFSPLAGHLLQDVAPEHLVTPDGGPASPDALPPKSRDAPVRAAFQQAAGQLLTLETASRAIEKEITGYWINQAKQKEEALRLKEQEDAAYAEMLKAAEAFRYAGPPKAGGGMPGGGDMGHMMMGSMPSMPSGGSYSYTPPTGSPMPTMAPTYGAPMPYPPPGMTSGMPGAPYTGTPYPTMPGVTVYQGALPTGAHFADQASMEAAARAAGKTPAEMGYFTGPLPPGTAVMPGPGMPGGMPTGPFAGMTEDQMKSMATSGPGGMGMTGPGGPGQPGQFYPGGPIALPHPMEYHPMEWGSTDVARGVVEGMGKFDVTKDSDIKTLSPEELAYFYYTFKTDAGLSAADRIAQVYEVGDTAAKAQMDRLARDQMMPQHMQMIFGDPFMMAWGEEDEGDEWDEDEDDGDEVVDTFFLNCAEAGLDAMRAAAGDFRLAKSNMPEACLELVKDERDGDDFCLEVRLSAALEAGVGATDDDVNAILKSKRYGADECVHAEGGRVKVGSSGRSCIEEHLLPPLIDNNGDVRAAVQEVRGEIPACDAYFDDYLADEVQPVGRFALLALVRTLLEHGDVSGVNAFLEQMGWGGFVAFGGPPDYPWTSPLVQPEPEEVTLQGKVVVDPTTGSVYLWINDQYIPLVTSTDIDLDDHDGAVVQVTGFGDEKIGALDVIGIEVLEVAEVPEEEEIVEAPIEEGGVREGILAELSDVVTGLIEDSTAIIEHNADADDAQSQHEVTVAQEALVAATDALEELTVLVTLDAVGPVSVIQIVEKLLTHEEAVAEITGEQHASAPGGPEPGEIIENFDIILNEMMPRIETAMEDTLGEVPAFFSTALEEAHEAYEVAVDECEDFSPNCGPALGNMGEILDGMGDAAEKEMIGYGEAGMELMQEVESEILPDYERLFGGSEHEFEGEHEGEFESFGEPEPIPVQAESEYRQMWVLCQNGKETTQGGESSCKSLSTWQDYANTFCDGQCDLNTGTCGVKDWDVKEACGAEYPAAQ